jgi:hypothetical protein
VAAYARRSIGFNLKVSNEDGANDEQQYHRQYFGKGFDVISYTGGEYIDRWEWQSLNQTLIIILVLNIPHMGDSLPQRV